MLYLVVVVVLNPVVVVLNAVVVVLVAVVLLQFTYKADQDCQIDPKGPCHIYIYIYIYIYIFVYFSRSRRSLDRDRRSGSISLAYAYGSGPWFQIPGVGSGFRAWGFGSLLQGFGISGFGITVEARNLEHGFRRIRARIPYNFPWA